MSASPIGSSSNNNLFEKPLGAGLDAAFTPWARTLSPAYRTTLRFLSSSVFLHPQQFTIALDRPIKEALIDDNPNENHRLLRHLRKITKPEITLKALMLTVSNGPYFGMNFAVAPHQRMDDGLITATSFQPIQQDAALAAFCFDRFWTRDYRPKSIAFRVASLQISGPRKLPCISTELLKNISGPCRIECRKGALTVFRPS